MADTKHKTQIINQVFASFTMDRRLGFRLVVGVSIQISIDTNIGIDNGRHYYCGPLNPFGAKYTVILNKRVNKCLKFKCRKVSPYSFFCKSVYPHHRANQCPLTLFTDLL